MAEQQQFDWQKETAKCVEGLKFDLEQDYHFELVWEGVELYQTSKKLDDGTKVLSVYSKGAKIGQPVLKYKFPFRELNSNVEFRLEYFHNESYRINPTNPELEDEIVKLSRKFGYNPVIDGNFTIKDFIKAGIKFTAKLKELPPTKAGKVYKEIDVDTIVLEGGEGGSKQGNLEEAISPEAEKEVKELAKGCKKFAELVTKISKAGKSDELLDVAMKMKSSGVIKF